MESFRAFRIHWADGQVDPRLETITLDDLADGDVVVRGEYSSVNYKDALAATGAGRILRTYPLVGGVDIAGTVVASSDPRVVEGQAVVVCGCGLSETHDGGFAEYARVRGDWVTPLPPGLDARTAMAIGTAGFTAGLAIHRMEQNDQHPGLGPVAVTGATGGVGSLACDLLNQLGYTVAALTRKPAQADYLRQIGAHEIVDVDALELATRPLEKARWGGAIDNVGGPLLAWLTRTVVPYGNIASIGLAGGAELETTVMPFILRGVSLIGINSVSVPRELRIAVWNRLGAELRPRHLDRVVTGEVTLDELPGVFQPYVDGTITGRTLVRLR